MEITKNGLMDEAGCFVDDSSAQKKIPRPKKLGKIRRFAPIGNAKPVMDSTYSIRLQVSSAKSVLAENTMNYNLQGGVATGWYSFPVPPYIRKRQP